MTRDSYQLIPPLIAVLEQKVLLFIWEEDIFRDFYCMGFNYKLCMLDYFVYTQVLCDGALSTEGTHLHFGKDARRESQIGTQKDKQN